MDTGERVRRRVVLVVHEDLVARESLATSLTNAGWSVRVAERFALAAEDAGLVDVDYVLMPMPANSVRSLEHVEWEHIQSALFACRGNVSQASRLLGVHRRTLQRRLRASRTAASVPVS